ncbi:MAG: hypothetical protein COB23_03340 [Methylophaga sp.]|nr:MAG: hypothetical protein COB23_03340 [Methylophaga sp.]
MSNHSALEQLEPTFKMILQQRMVDVPVINHSLTVKAIGFHQWNDYQLGILITPWFMNLMLLPTAETEDHQTKIGSTQTYVFPSGAYDFMVGFEDGLGIYLSCSLFSPMFEFADQAAAESTATAAIAAIMDEDNEDVESQSHSQEIAKIWADEQNLPTAQDDVATESPPDDEPERKSLSERINEPTSRRDFLRGKVFTENLEK